MIQDINVLLVCAAGASTSMLANRVQELTRSYNWTVEARSYTELANVIGKYDVVLVAPQLRYEFQHIESIVSQYEGIKVKQIESHDFAALDPKIIVDKVNELYGVQQTKKGERQMSQKVSVMDKISAVMEKYIVPVGMKISNQRHLAAVRDGLTVMIPITIIGGFACLIAVPPIPSTITEPSNFFYAFLLAWQSFAGQYSNILMLPYQLTIGIISIYVVCGVAYQLASTYKMNGINNMITALLVYLCVSGAIDLASGTIVIANLGAGYMFTAMVVALLVVEINHFFIKHNITIKLPASVPPNVAAPFNVLIPGVVNVVVFLLLDLLCSSLTGAGLSRLVYTIFQPLMSATG